MSPGRSANQHLPRPASWTEGPPPEWLGLDLSERKLSLADLVSSIPAPPSQKQVEQWGAGADREPAAVLCLLRDTADGPTVVITRRPWAMRSHSGELSFPGGGREHGEPLIDTARRETFEEVGIEPSRIEIVGALRPIQTFSSRRLVMPYVGVWDGTGAVRADSEEVAEVLHVSVNRLVGDSAAWREHWAFPSIELDVNFFGLDDDVIWGATASMLCDLLLRSLHDRMLAAGLALDHRPQPRSVLPPEFG